jgi:uncharacterized protein (DUF1697 family)
MPFAPTNQNFKLRTLNSELKTFFLFLRAINVGGHNTIKMKDLSEWMQQLGFTGVRTYLNSGNVVFQTSRNDVVDLSTGIREKIRLEAKLDIACFVRSLDELIRIINMLLEHEATKPESATVFVTFLSGQASAEGIQKLKTIDSGSDTFIPYGSEIVLICQQPYHKTKLSNSFFEKTLKLDATSRNRNTIELLLKDVGGKG